MSTGKAGVAWGAVSDGAISVLARFGPMVYAPTILFSLGEGAVIPLIPTLATELGTNVAGAALITATLVVGQLCGNIPAGWAVARFGERLTMVVSGVVSMIALLAMVLFPHIGVLAAAVFVIGLSAASFGLARHAFMTTRVPVAFRARALSLLGGSFRLGVFIGPFVGAGLMALFGTEEASLWFFLVCLAAMLVLVLFGPDPEKTTPVIAQGSDVLGEDSGEAVTGSIPVTERQGVLRTIARHRTVLSRLGLAAASLSAVRAARQALIPLWGVSLGLDGQTIAVVVGVSGAIDFALFYASGQVMDRFGRLWAAMPSMILMGLAFLALSFTHDLDQSVLWFGMTAAVLGVGNGFSSGILLTLGADTAPPGDPAPYLGAWRTLTDAGGAAAPLLITGITALASLPLAAAAMGVIGLAGAVGFLRWIPRFAPRSPRPVTD